MDGAREVPAEGERFVCCSSKAWNHVTEFLRRRYFSLAKLRQ